MPVAEKLLLFDLDGTLVNTAPDLAAATDAALETLGCAAAGEARARRWIGNGIDVMVRRALANAGVPLNDRLSHRKALRAFLDYYAAHTLDRGHVYAGVVESLEELTQRGVRCCCVTNKRQALADATLQLAGIETYFQLVIGGDRVSRKKPDPESVHLALEHFAVTPDDAVLIGDSPNDFGASTAAGVPFIFVEHGYGTVDRESCVSIESFAGLDEALARFGF